MPTLEQRSSGDVVRALQTLLTNGAAGQWVTTPLGNDGDFGPHTRASVKAFQAWGSVVVDGIVGDQTWSVSLARCERHAGNSGWVELRYRLTTHVWDGLEDDPHDLSTLCKPLLVPEREGLKWQQQKS